MPIEQLFPIITSDFKSAILPQTIQYIIAFSPILFALILALIFWPLWVRYVHAKFFLAQKYVLLEIKLPRDTFKSPLAMELFLTALHQTGGESTWYAKYWLGQTRPWFSLEMVSLEGQVKFFIWSRAGFRSFIESSLYAQFPGIEVHERQDYSKGMHFDPKEMSVWAAELALTKEDAYPIKTYIDYGLDKDPKEEFKVDPLAPFIEFLGGVGPNQQVWIQILVRAHKKEHRKAGHFWKTTDRWRDDVERIINEIMIRDPKTKITGEEDEETGMSKKPTLAKHEQNIIEAIGRSLEKQPYDVGIRAVYIAKDGFFNVANIGGILGSWKQFGSPQLNGFKPTGWHTIFDYPWQDYKNYRRNKKSREVLAAYKRRGYFYTPYEHKSFVLNSEELATIFHFPGAVAGTPTFERIPSKKGEAPSNLPL
jgi:hypothetical protein